MDYSRHILVVEDDMKDFELISHVLIKESQQYSLKRIESPEELAEELDRRPPGLVLCDHSGAQWDSFAVLERVRAWSEDLPFIIVSGGMPEAMWQQALAMGADDLVLKHQLDKLGPAIRRALRLAMEIQLRRRAEAERDRLRQELQASLARPDQAKHLVRLCARCKKVPDGTNNWVQLEHYLHHRLAIDFSHGLCPVCMEHYCTDLHQSPGESGA